ncbi:MAG: UDP-2,3-diacylglucosamine diphosphatase [Candidatus Amulumruptor caecigallinarius]|nr:UDP-2,3-diacylglucosamine diphosphatase [Candidatus Amulumruptor caecigallinarius]
MIAYFLSDLHLGAPYFPDSKAAEKRVTDFLDSVKNEADAIFLVGDVLDYWYEYRYVVPRGFVRFFGKLAELSDMGVKIVWFIGNHDIWIFDYLPSELGIEVVDGWKEYSLNGHKFLITHGDGIGKLKPSFKFLRRLFRNRLCQCLFSGIHPRWTVPFAYNWSRHSRKMDGPSPEDAKRMLANVEDFSKTYLEEHPDVEYFIYGHLHLLRDIPISSDHGSVRARIIILGEWIAQNSYARWDGARLTLHRYEEKDPVK